MMLSFYLGYVYANYHWFKSYMGTMMTVVEQSSVEFSLVYMEKYLAGDKNGAQLWVENHALSNPVWNLHEDEDWEYWMDTFDPPSWVGMEKVRLDKLKEIRIRQQRIRRELETDAETESLK